MRTLEGPAGIVLKSIKGITFMSWEVFLGAIGNPILAYWVQAIGSIASIWGAFAVGRSQQKSQLNEAIKAARDRTYALAAVVESAALFVTVLGKVVQAKPAPLHFKENWKLVNRQWLESSVFSLSQLPVHELGTGELVRGYFGILGGIKDISRLIDEALSADALHEQEFTYMYDEVLKQVSIIESCWYGFQRALPKKA